MQFSGHEQEWHLLGWMGEGTLHSPSTFSPLTCTQEAFVKCSRTGTWAWNSISIGILCAQLPWAAVALDGESCLAYYTFEETMELCFKLHVYIQTVGILSVYCIQ